MHGSVKLIALFALFFTTCKKNDDPPPVPGSLRLAEIWHTDNSSSDTLKQRFVYDMHGRLTKMILTWRNTPYAEPYEISYPDAQTVVINFPFIGDRFPIAGRAPFEKVVVFKLDGKGRPLARYERAHYNLDPPASLQRSLRLDTTYYRYGSDGLLESTICRYFDSVYAPGAGIYRQSYTDTTFYTNKNGNLEGGRSSGYDTTIRYSAGPIGSVIFRYKKTLTLNYQEQWPLGNYGKNAFIYHELRVFVVKAQQVALPYRNLANRSEEIRDLFDLAGNYRGGGENIEDLNTTSTQFNDLNLITRMTCEDTGLGREFVTEYIYSR